MTVVSALSWIRAQFISVIVLKSAANSCENDPRQMRLRAHSFLAGAWQNPSPTRETGVCPAKQTVNRRERQSRDGEQSRSFGGRGNQALAPGDRRKTGLRGVGGGTGRYGVPPLEWVVPHKVGAQGKTFPLNTVGFKCPGACKIREFC